MIKVNLEEAKKALDEEVRLIQTSKERDVLEDAASRYELIKEDGNKMLLDQVIDTTTQIMLLCGLDKAAGFLVGFECCYMAFRNHFEAEQKKCDA